MNTKHLLGALGAALLSASLAPSAHATITTPDFDYTVTLNVASLTSNLNGPFSLDLQLVEGSGNVSNTVKVYNFSTTGVSSGFGSTSYSGGSETGGMGPGGIVTLTNSQSDNELAETFAAGTQTISFNVDETPNDEITGSNTPTPDQFNIAILDGNINNIPTTDSLDAPVYTLVQSDLGQVPDIESFSSVSPDGGVTVALATPEPSSYALALMAAGGMLGLAFLRRRHAA